MSQRIVATITLIFATGLVYSVEFTKADFECKSPGKFPYPNNSNYYYECYYIGNGNFTVFKHSCPELNCFDAIELACSVVSCESEMTSERPVEPFSCPGPGKFRHPDKSRNGTFYKCIRIEGSLYAYEYQCLSSKPCYFEHSSSCEICNKPTI